MTLADPTALTRALRALYCEPYFEKATDSFGGEIIFVGEPTGEALRVAGQWPSPELQLQRLIEAFEAVAAHESRPEEERSRAGIGLRGPLGPRDHDGCATDADTSAKAASPMCS